jgi:transcriptional regulator
MHPNPAFHDKTAAQNLAFARARGFGILSMNGEHGPLMAHIPFCLSQSGTCATLHLVRSNPITRALKTPTTTPTLTPTPAVIAISGPDSYISPAWYGAPDMVPTWNYTAVHLRGTLARLPATDLRPVLDDLARTFETRLLPKPPWTNAKMPTDALEKMMKMIVPFRFDITRVDGTWKLGQNKPDSARTNAANQVRSNGLGQETARLATLMHPS